MSRHLNEINKYCHWQESLLPVARQKSSWLYSHGSLSFLAASDAIPDKLRRKSMHGWTKGAAPNPLNISVAVVI